MQIFWISGPVGQIHSFNLSFKTIAIAFLVLVVVLITVGSALQFFGFRFALEYDPSIARQLGNLYTAGEIENLDAIYRSRLKNVEAEQGELIKKVGELEAVNAKLKTMLIPKSMIKSRPDANAQGGPEKRTGLETGDRHSLLDSLSEFYALSRSRNKSVGAEAKRWSDDLVWIAGLPTGLPILSSGSVLVSSPFGERVDPVTHRRSLHPGMDFSVPPQTPILAAGNGTVIKAGWDSEYGQEILISHGDGVVSRYAHASELLVQSGAKVTRGQLIAKSGNTGRSTGPHLHFEVIRDNQVVDPGAWLAIAAAM